MRSKTNVLLVWDRMGDYHRARWSAVQEKLPNINVYAADLGSSDFLYGWKDTANSQNYFKLSAKRPEQIDFARILRFVSILKKQNIGTVCISGYGKLEYIIFILYGSLSGRRVIIFAESWYPGNRWVDKFKSIFLRITCDGFLVSGLRASEHFITRLRITRSKIKSGYSVVDNNHFRRVHQVARKKLLLCVARFSPEKNLRRLIETFINSELFKKKWELVIVGGGPLKEELNNARGSSNQVKLIDWQSYDELPSIYHSASAFILPSNFEPWGLVVNEAMAAGLPVLLSERVGCVPDLLRDGLNGSQFYPECESLLEILNRVADYSDETLLQMGKESEAIIQEYSLQTFATNLSSLITNGYRRKIPN